MMTSFLESLKKESPMMYFVVTLLLIFGSAEITSSESQSTILSNLETSIDVLSEDVDHLRTLVSVHGTQLQLIELQLDDLPVLASKDEVMEQRIAVLESRIAVLEAFSDRD